VHSQELTHKKDMLT